MSLSVGSTSVDPGTGALGGTGLSYALATALDTWLSAHLGSFGIAPAGDDLVKQRQGIADFAHAFAAPIITYLTGNAVCHVTISTSQGGLQTDPDSGDPTNPPSATKTLTGSLS